MQCLLHNGRWDCRQDCVTYQSESCLSHRHTAEVLSKPGNHISKRLASPPIVMSTPSHALYLSVSYNLSSTWRHRIYLIFKIRFCSGHERDSRCKTLKFIVVTSMLMRRRRSALFSTEASNLY